MAKSTLWPHPIRISTLCVSLALSTIASSAMPKSKASSPVASGPAAEAKSIIKSILIDPTSAQFTLQPLKRSSDMQGNPTTVVCGTFNSKNRFGGYVGPKSFAYDVNSKTVFDANLEKIRFGNIVESADAIAASTEGAASYDVFTKAHDRLDALNAEIKFWLTKCDG